MRLGRKFGWFWAAFTASAFGTWFAFDAFPLIAILALHVGPAEVSLLAAAGLAAGAALAVPLGPWVERRRKRPAMIAMDLVRAAVLISVPVAFAAGALTFAHLLVAAIVVGASSITFKAASGAYVKALVPPEALLEANGRLQSTSWIATAVGPPLGGVAIGIFGPVATVVVDACSYLMSAAGLVAIGGREVRPAPRTSEDLRAADLLEGWRHILSHPGLRGLFFNTMSVNGLILATAPLLAVMMLGELGFTPWQYGLAFAAPCVGGLVGSRVARPLVARFGQQRVLFVSGALRACWSFGLAFLCPAPAGLALVIGVELGLVTCAGVFVPVFATYRLEQTPGDKVARVLLAWTVSNSAAVALMTAAWGLLASVTSPRAAIATAGVLLIATPLLIPRAEAGEARAPAVASLGGERRGPG